LRKGNKKSPKIDSSAFYIIYVRPLKRFSLFDVY